LDGTGLSAGAPYLSGLSATLVHPAAEADETRKALAMRIVDCAIRGERDLEELRAYALAGM
jgi:hypothetical protein